MAHIHDKIDFTVSVYIVRDNAVLLHIHKKLGIWLPPGGHIELDEDPVEAVLREAQEEAGLAITLVGEKPENFGTIYAALEITRPRFLQKHFFDVSHTHQHIDFVYFATASEGDVRPEIQGGEIRWLTKENIESMPEILPDVRKYALKAIEEIGGRI